MQIESIVYEEHYMNLSNPSITETVDSFLIKSNGIIVRNLDGTIMTYAEATKEDFYRLEKEIIEFIEKADHTVYFIGNMKVDIVILYEDGTKQIMERGLACQDEFFDSIIEDYLDEYTEV